VAERGTGNETILVIGYGNELRGDDGLGVRVVEAIAGANLPGVRVITSSQLVPELAAELAEARLAIFVDALEDARGSGVELLPLSADATTDWITHRADPRSLLALTRAVYRRVPEAWWVMVAGHQFDFGEGLSAVGEANVGKARERIRTLIVGHDQPPWTSPTVHIGIATFPVEAL
jgi:hydrogenase maturation protease